MIKFLRTVIPLFALAGLSSAFAAQEAYNPAPDSTAAFNITPPAGVHAPVSQPHMTPAQFRQWLATIKANRRHALAPRHAPPFRTRVPAPPPLTYEQGQQAMIATLPSSSLPQPEDSDAAFQAMMQQNMPLSPQQVVRMHQQIDLSQRASAVTPNIPPKSVSSTIMMNLAPGATPPAIRLSQGYVSSMVFVDSTGTPWPIASFDVGNPKAVNMQWDGKSNILLIQSVAPYTSGDIVVRLVGLATPITLELVSGQRVVDYRVDIHVPGIGPNTKELPIGTDLPNSANQLLLGVLDGIAPPGSRSLNIIGASNNSQAWGLGDRIYLRTRLTLLSPGWVGKMVSPDGMTAYELPKTSSVLVSRYGEPIQLKIEGF
ncbi:MAG TPA: DotH/IcmK family type IV secretion protein [Gammaproteobacteria bacterium]|jgi:intracellular multiplication protein IcmK|nr:DotH/IcmK family type IV secretion protein [Gammaproteobacteria bacterium]